MNIFKDIPPTAGFPLFGREIVSALRMKGSGDALAEDLKEYLSAHYAHTTCSGTAALYLICESIKALTSRRTIIIPSFICPLVAFAVKRAGFNAEICDIGKADFNFSPDDLEALCSANSDIGAIVIDHLAGIPFDFDALEQAVKKHGLLVIEDCAQSLGARYKGHKVGTMGDFSFFSFAAGKGLTLYEGGMAVANSREYGALLHAAINRLVKNDFFIESLRALELLGYWIFYRPRLFWFVFTLPNLLWNLFGNSLKAVREDFDSDFPVHRVSQFRNAIGHGAFHRLEEQIAQQRLRAAWYFDGLKGLKGITVIREAALDRATYPYVTVLFDNPDAKKTALKNFATSGLGVSQAYALAIADYPYMKDSVPERNCANARSVAERSITLSTSTFLKKKDAEEVISILKKLV